SEVYVKSKVLYGLFEAKKAIRQKDNCILVEGYTDVTSLNQAGVENVVASSGTALTAGQIRQIKRFTQNLTLLYDGDPAGIRASLRGIDLVLAEDMNVSAVVLPDGEDPDSYVRKYGGAAFEDFLEREKKDFVRFRAELSLQLTQNDPIERAKVIREIAQTVAQIPDPFKRSVFSQQASELLGVEEAIFISEVNKLLLQKQKQESRELERQAQAEAPPPDMPPTEEAQTKTNTAEVFDTLAAHERELLRLLVLHGQKSMGEDLRVCDYLFSETDDLAFSHPVCKKIWARYQRLSEQGFLVDENRLLAEAEPDESRLISDLVVTKNDLSQNWVTRYDVKLTDEDSELPDTLYKNLLRLKLRVLRDVIQQNLKNLQTATDPEELQDIQLIHLELKKEEMELAEALGNVIVR
ncbi:MAG: toprim domain-containing protein, partial [Bacteroidota bacterium]